MRPLRHQGRVLVATMVAAHYLLSGTEVDASVSGLSALVSVTLVASIKVVYESDLISGTGVS